MNFKGLFDQYLAFINRLVPKSAQAPVIGMDIGTSAIKAVVVGHGANGLEIRRWAIERVEAGDARPALKKVTQRLSLNDQVLVSAVSGKGTLTRYMDLPRMPLEDLRKSFVYDLDQYFPFDPQSIYADCAILDPDGKDKRMSVLIVAVKKELVDAHLNLFKEAGLELNHVTINAVATANAFERLGPQAAGPTPHAKAVLDIGASVSNLMIFKNFSPRFTRDIFVGSQELTKQIANVLGVDPTKAEEIKCLPGDKLKAVIEACEAPINNLISEIRLSIDYFITEKNIQVDELFLFGGGSLLQGMEGAFEKNLGMAVKIWNPLARGVRLTDQAASSGIQTYSAQLGVALGLGLGTYD